MTLLRAATESSEDEANEEEAAAQDEAIRFWGRLKAYFFKGKKDESLTFKQRLAKMGVATVLSYGMISNLSYAILVALAWFGFSAKVRVLLHMSWQGCQRDFKSNF